MDADCEGFTIEWVRSYLLVYRADLRLSLQLCVEAVEVSDLGLLHVCRGVCFVYSSGPIRGREPLLDPPCC